MPVAKPAVFRYRDYFLYVPYTGSMYTTQRALLAMAKARRHHHSLLRTRATAPPFGGLSPTQARRESISRERKREKLNQCYLRWMYGTLAIFTLLLFLSSFPIRAGRNSPQPHGLSWYPSPSQPFQWHELRPSPRRPAQRHSACRPARRSRLCR